jgi:RNA recognition motif-containing protein
MQEPAALDRILADVQVVDEKKVDCKRAVPRDASHLNAPNFINFKTNKMFVGGLPPDVNNEMFREFFLQFGEIDDSIVILDKDTGRSRGFGFITFVNEESADRVLENYEKNMIHGKWVECKKATPKVTQSYNLPSYPVSSFSGSQVFSGLGFGYPYSQSFSGYTNYSGFSGFSGYSYADQDFSSSFMPNMENGEGFLLGSLAEGHLTQSSEEFIPSSEGDSLKS